MLKVFHCFYKNHFYILWLNRLYCPYFECQDNKGKVCWKFEKLTQMSSHFYILFFKSYEIKDIEGKKNWKRKAFTLAIQSPFSTMVEIISWEVSTEGNCYKLKDTPARTSPSGPTSHPMSQARLLRNALQHIFPVRMLEREALLMLGGDNERADALRRPLVNRLVLCWNTSSRFQCRKLSLKKKSKASRNSSGELGSRSVSWYSFLKVKPHDTGVQKWKIISLRTKQI